jgi:hypothetical protein
VLHGKKATLIVMDDFDMAFSSADVRKINTIKDIFRAKMEDFVTELPMAYTQYFKDGIITGGAFASLWHREEPKDWDFYFNDSNNMSRFQALVMNGDPAGLLLQCVKDTGPYFTQVQVDGKLVTANAVTLDCGLQMITMATAAHRKYFDFIHCMPYYDIHKDELYISPQQLDAIKRKQIIKNPNFKGTPKPFRVEKYLDRGWSLLTTDTQGTMSHHALRAAPAGGIPGEMRLSNNGTTLEYYDGTAWVMTGNQKTA